MLLRACNVATFDFCQDKVNEDVQRDLGLY